MEHDISLVAAHIQGCENSDADQASRKFNDDIEYMLDTSVFSDVICKKFGVPKIDCFASRINNQLANYFSWKPDPHAELIDAFTC